MLRSPLLPLLLAAVLVSAMVEFTSPPAGATVDASDMNVTWKESGYGPPINELGTYQLFLYAGGNDPSTYVRI